MIYNDNLPEGYTAIQTQGEEMDKVIYCDQLTDEKIYLCKDGADLMLMGVGQYGANAALKAYGKLDDPNGWAIRTENKLVFWRINDTVRNQTDETNEDSVG